jgi:hypothetical protein
MEVSGGGNLFCNRFRPLASVSAPATLPLPFARSPISGNHKFVFFNPFRNRGPERAAQRFFDDIKSGACVDFAAVGFGVTLPNNVTCEELHEIVSGPRYKGVLDQRLRDRVDNGISSSLWFSDDGYGGNQVMLEKRGNQWHVTGFLESLVTQLLINAVTGEVES